MCSTPWKAIPKAMRTPSADIVYTDATGELDLLPGSEVDAVSLSGRSDWRDYAVTPSQWPDKTVPFVPLMEGRPGAIAYGSRPANVPAIPSRRSKRSSPLERKFVLMMGHLTNVNLAHVMCRDIKSIRAIRNEFKIPPRRILWNSPEEIRTARLMWLSWVGEE